MQTSLGQDQESPDTRELPSRFPSTSSRASSWNVVDPDEAANDAPTPHVSLFAQPPTVLPSTSSDNTLESALAHVGGFSTAPSPSPLSIPTSAVNMTRRTARLTVPDEQPPIAPLTPQIPSAQKDVDDPTTPIDTPRTSESRGRNTPKVLSQLFAGDATMSTSRTPSYTNATGPLYLRASSDSISLPDHLYARGLLEGRHSDITIIAFGERYNLHRLILDRAPFFTTALSEPWLESRSKEVHLHPEEVDNNITKAAFELAIRKLYGVDISRDCDNEAVGLFAVGCWLEMQDLIDASVESILRQMGPDTLSPLIRLVTLNYYGRSGDRILESAKAMLSRNGWEMPLRYWDGMPGDIIRELVGSDGFFVHNEWDRWVLAKRLLDRRLRQAAVDAGLIERGRKPIPKAPDSLSLMAVRFDSVYRQHSSTVHQSTTDANAAWLALYTNPDIEPILVLLDEGIHYIHMDYEQLEAIRKARDIFGLPVMPEKVISDALWQQLALRQRVMTTDPASQELGLCKSPPDPVSTTPKASKGKQNANALDDQDAMESGSWDGNGRARKFWIPSADCNIVLGNGTDPVVTTSNSFQRHASRLSATIQPEDAQWATDFASSPSTMANPNTKTTACPGRPISAGGSNAGQPKPIAYTEFPPFRFSAEFPNPRYLKEKKRVYSRTVSYAGSLWNIYIQKVRTAKNVQLGVYLHRAKERESEEQVVQSSGLSHSQQNGRSVDERIGQLEREMLLRSERRERNRRILSATNARTTDTAGEDDNSGSGNDADSTLVSNSSLVTGGAPLFPYGGYRRRRSNRTSIPPAFQLATTSDREPESGTDLYTAFSGDDDDDEYMSESSSNDEPMSAYPNPSLLHVSPTSPSTSNSKRLTRTTSSSSTLPTYVDARPTIRTYFKIYSPSKGGRMLSIYESAPDRFNFSQSWGWKSSTLMLDEIALNGGDEAMGGEGEDIERRVERGSKLRFMVVIGNL